MVSWVRPWKRAGEGDDALPSGMGTRDFYRVFRGFRAGREKDRLGVLDRGERIQPLGQFDVILIPGHLKRDMGEFFALRAYGRHHRGVAMAGIGHCDAGAEIDIAVALNIPDLAVFGFCHENGGCRCQAAWNSLRSPSQNRCVVRHESLSPKDPNTVEYFLRIAPLGTHPRYV